MFIFKVSCPEIGLDKKCKNMERYSRVSDSKWQSIYSEEFKRFVCNEYLSGSMTKKEVELKHDLGNGRLTYWLRERGFGDLKTHRAGASILLVLTAIQTKTPRDAGFWFA